MNYFFNMKVPQIALVVEEEETKQKQLYMGQQSEELKICTNSPFSLQTMEKSPRLQRIGRFKIIQNSFPAWIQDLYQLKIVN